jgi:alkaline phosphatase D
VGPEITRRTLLARGGIGAGALILGGVPVLADAQRTRRRAVPFARTGAFPQGVASGEPAANGITLWTRLGGGYRTDRKLLLEISPDPDFRRVVYRRNVVARAEKDHAITVRVRNRALRPGERYHYRFHTREVDGPVGRFRTMRPADSREPVRIAFFACQKWNAGHYGAHATIAALEDVDLVVCLGDYIYETGGRDVREDKTGEAGTGFAETLADYRDKYRLYRSDPDLQAMHAAHPFTAIWDDHEVENDYAGDSPGSARERRVEFPERRHNGYRAFFDYMPIGRLGSGFGLYRSIPIGRTAELFLLDERQYRDDQPCGNEDFAPCPDAGAPGRELLGPEQLAWLKQGLAGSQATWKLLANQVMVMALETAAGQPINKDQWDGYAAERAELLGFVRDRGIADVAFLTGDVHSFFAGDVGVDGRGPGSVATEFVGGSVTSLGIPEGFQEETGVPLSREQFAELANVRATNPHIKYDEQLSRGYGVLEARADELLVEYRGVEARERSTEARTVGRFRVARGVPRVEVV